MNLKGEWSVQKLIGLLETVDKESKVYFEIDIEETIAKDIPDIDKQEYKREIDLLIMKLTEEKTEELEDIRAKCYSRNYCALCPCSGKCEKYRDKKEYPEHWSDNKISTIVTEYINEELQKRGIDYRIFN